MSVYKFVCTFSKKKLFYEKLILRSPESGRYDFVSQWIWLHHVCALKSVCAHGCVPWQWVIATFFIHFFFTSLCTFAQALGLGLMGDFCYTTLQCSLMYSRLDPSHFTISPHAKTLLLMLLRNICSRRLLERVQQMKKYRNEL